MLKIKDLDKYEITLRDYKGHFGSKIGLKINGENYLEISQKRYGKK